MFLVLVDFLVELPFPEPHLADHREFLRLQYEHGVFVLSGLQVPREGGIIIAQTESRAQIEAIMRTDPFVREGLTSFRIVEFEVLRSAGRFAEVTASQ